MSGNSKSIQDLMKIIKRETLLMDQSEGGVTFSGGEPLHHYKFLIEMLDACGEEGIHRCVDTTGFANASIFLEVAKRTDLFLYDLKMMNSEKHKKFTGVPNEKILQNLQLLATLGADYIIRIPLIKDINDDEENIRQTAAFIASLPGEKKPVQILPYHNIAVNKHIKLGHAGKAVVHKSPDTSSQEMALSIFDEHRISVEIGT
jgi:pyruvate formate lyase activating enzyme